MSEGFLSPDWYRVASLRLRRRSHIQTARHVYRGEPWFVVQDLQADKLHRLTPQSYAVFARMDGRRTIQELWELACKLHPEHPPSQPELLQLLSQFHNADLVTGDRRPNLAEIDRRAREETRKATVGYFKNPLSIRLPLFDPEPMLRPLTPLARVMFSPVGGFFWVTLMITALSVLFLSWERLEAPGVEAILSAANIAYLAVAYIFVKLLHEFGHGLAIKRWGGEVREVGVMMLIFFPVPYVDASQASFFPEKHQRMLVSAAGVLVELAIAAAALIVWSIAEQGPVATLAYNLFLIGGISTLLFNGNPLLRFDGYFVFADWLESPNLGQRCNQYFWYVVQKHVLGHSEARLPVVSPGEEGWLFGYAVAAFLYRMFVMVIISLYVATVIPVVGVAIVLWSIFTVLVVPTAKGVRFLATDPSLEVQRPKALLRASILIAAFAVVMFAVPFPHTTIADAVLDNPSNAQVRAQGQGFVSQILVENGEQVAAGTPILRLTEPFLDVEYAVAATELEDARLRLEMVPIEDSNARALWAEQVGFYSARHGELERRFDELLIRAPTAGVLVLPDQRSLTGRLLQQGEVIGSIERRTTLIWRSAVPADRADFVDNDMISATLKPNAYPYIEYPVEIFARAPQVTTRLDSFGLTNRAGGRLVADPSQEGPVSMVPIVAYVLSSGLSDEAHPTLGVGARATVRFAHSPAPLAPRIWRAVRQTFLTYFGT